MTIRSGIALLTLTTTCLFTAFGFASFSQSAKKEYPVIPGDFADPSIIRNGNTYLATGTSSEWSPHFPGQITQCNCNADSLMNKATISCDTTILSNKSKLYWQFTCDKIWLTLENPRGQKVVIDQVPVEYYSYTYRLGFHLIKEFEKTVLFRSDCPANGPCIYTLIDKSTGRKTKEFGQLICIDTEIAEETEYLFDFLVYPDLNYKNLVIEYVNTRKKITIPFDFKKKNLTAAIPEYQFDRMKLNENILTIYYTTSSNNQLDLKIDLSNKKYVR